jgi:hypothetical protein
VHVKSEKTGEFNECSPHKYRIIARKNGSQALLIKAPKGLVLPVFQSYDMLWVS